MSKVKATKKPTYKSFGNSVKALPHQASVVNVKVAKLFHAMIGNLYNPKLALNVDVSKYVCPADLYAYNAIKVAEFHCEHGLVIPARVRAQIASLGFNATAMFDELMTMVKTVDGKDVHALYLYNGNKILADCISFPEALWVLCENTVKRSK